MDDNSNLHSNELLNPQPFYEAELVKSGTHLVPIKLIFNSSSNKIEFKHDDDKIKEIDYLDLLGSFNETKPIYQENQTNFHGKNLIRINFFPKISFKKCACRKSYKKRVLHHVQLLVPESKSGNLIKDLNSVINYMTLNQIEITYKRKLVVFINPIGGKGKSRLILEQIEGILNSSYLEYDIVKTQYYKHAYDVVLKLEKGQYHGIICISGDGIIHEVVNALFHREDSESFSIPIGVIPAGSSNGLAKTITSISDEDCNPQNCAYIIAQGHTVDIDILEIETINSNKKIYSFLGTFFGILADIDLNSESLRCLGSLRFEIYAFWRLINLKDCFGKFYYLPEDKANSYENIELPSFDKPLSNDFISHNENFRYFNICPQKYIGETFKCFPKSIHNDGLADGIILPTNNGRCNLLKLLLNQDSGDYFDSEGNIRRNSGVNYFKFKAFRLIPKARMNQDEMEVINGKITFPGFYSIDGERYPIEPIQGKVLKKRLKVYALNK